MHVYGINRSMVRSSLKNRPAKIFTIANFGHSGPISLRWDKPTLLRLGVNSDTWFGCYLVYKLNQPNFSPISSNELVPGNNQT